MEYDAIHALQRLFAGQTETDSTEVEGYVFGTLSSFQTTPTYTVYRAPTLGTWGAGISPDG